MLYKYALYAKNNKRIHLLLCLAMFIMFIVHILVLLETESVILLSALIIYVPIYIIWSRVSTMKGRMAE